MKSLIQALNNLASAIISLANSISTKNQTALKDKTLTPVTKVTKKKKG